MLIQLNGEPHTVEDGITAADLVTQFQLGDQRIAMEINQDILPRSQYHQYQIHDGDRVEIVHAIGGGSYPCLIKE